MNYQYFYYCTDECEYIQKVKVKKGEEEIQCRVCKNIQSHKINYKMKTTCKTCNHIKTFPKDTLFKDGMRCEQCGNKGEIGFDGVHDEYEILFTMELEKNLENVECEQCKRKEFDIKKETGWSCPDCGNTLKEKMSSYWEEE